MSVKVAELVTAKNLETIDAAKHEGLKNYSENWLKVTAFPCIDDCQKNHQILLLLEVSSRKHLGEFLTIYRNSTMF